MCSFAEVIYSWFVLQPESKLPVLVFIHGGAYTSVRKHCRNSLVACGILVICTISLQ